MSLFFIQQYIVAKTSQLLTEIQTTVNSSPITFGKVATNFVYADSWPSNTDKRLTLGFPTYTTHPEQ